MPYLDSKRKTELDNNPRQPAISAGDLTYLLYKASLDSAPLENEVVLGDALGAAIQRYLPQEPRFDNYAAVLGSLDATRRELYRRRKSSDWLDGMLGHLQAEFYAATVAPYEDQKIEQNGDVE